MNCTKVRFTKWTHALARATFDEQLYRDKRKVYWHVECQAYHTSREKVKVDVPLLER